MKQISLSSKIYADALKKLYLEGDKEILAKLNIVEEICNGSQDLNLILKNPTIAIDTKFSIIEEVFSKDLDKKFIDFIKILVEKNRFSEFEEISQAFKNEIDEINNIKHFEIVSAIKLSEDRKNTIKNRLQEKFNKNIVPSWTVDKDIIGGLIIKYDDNIIDNSLKNKLERLSKI